MTMNDITVASGLDALRQIEARCLAALAEDEDSPDMLGSDFAWLIYAFASMDPSADRDAWEKARGALTSIARTVAERLTDMETARHDLLNALSYTATRGKMEAEKERANAIAAARAEGDPRADAWEADERQRMRDAETDTLRRIQSARGAARAAAV